MSIKTSPEHKQLKDLTVIIAWVEYDDQSNPYAVTKRLHYDFVGPFDQLITHLEKSQQIIHKDE